MINNITKNQAPYLITVTRVYDVTPHLRCITFSAPALYNYPAEVGAAHIKVFLPRDQHTKPELPMLTDNGPVWRADAIRPVIRTYSIRAVRPQKGEIDIEFALHKHNGPAVNFARSAKLGDQIGISNPGGPKPMLPIADFYCLAGDPSSLPAISALLEDLPEHSRGYALIRIDTVADVINLKKPAGVQLSWIIGGTVKTTELITQFRTLHLPVEDTYFWLAGEDSLVVELRRYLRKELHCNRHQLYAVPYWREGLNEENYHNRRHEIMDNIDN